MQPLSGKPTGSSTLGKCSETRSSCIIWDGPDIKCLGVELCKGQSIDVIVYNTANTLCKILEELKIDVVDLDCLIQNPETGLPQNIQELTQLIVTKLCELNQDVIELQTAGTTDVYVRLPDCDTIIANCPSNVTTQYTDSQGNFVTSLLLISADGQTSPAVEYLATLICDLLCRMSSAESEIKDLRDDVDNLMNQAAGALPPVDIQCPTITTSTQIVDPNDATSGVLPDMGTVLCDTVTQLTGTNPVTTLNNYTLVDNCFTTLSSAAPLGVYPSLSPPPLKLEDLGAIPNPTNLQEIMTNVWVTLCDIRNFANIVKASCCPVFCASVITDMVASPPGAAVPGASTRDTIRVMMNGTFTNYYNAVLTVNSYVGSPGLDPAGPPSFFDGNLPYTITITDQTGNVATFTQPSISYLFTSGNYFDATGLTNPPFSLINTEDYTVTLTGTVVAPDYTVCNVNLTTIVPAICDNEPLVSLTNAFVGFDGVTVQYTLPTTPGWPSSGTVPEQFVIEVYDVATGSVVDTGYIDYYNYTPNYIYIYGDSDNILPSPGACTSGCLNYFQTAAIHPNSSYQIIVSIKYNCGTSVGTASPTFKTFVPIVITLDASSADACVVQGNISLVPNAGTPLADLSSNFTASVPFVPNTPVTSTVYAKAGTTFGFILNTPYIIEAPLSTQACPANSAVRCWGPPSLYKYYPGNTALSVFEDTEKQYTYEGCFDYVDCLLNIDGNLGYTGPSTFANINNNGVPGQDEPGNAVATLDNSQTTLGTYYPLTIPSGYNVNGPINISINPTLHLLNSSSRPSLSIIIDDPGANLSSRNLMYLQTKTLASKTVAYNGDILGWFSLAGYTPVSTSYVSSAAAWTAIPTPTGVPAFVQIEVFKWLGTQYATSPNFTYYVTGEWLEAGLPNLTTTGFVMNTGAIQLRDKIKISWTPGCYNNNGSGYVSGGGTIGIGDVTYGKLEISQNPYPGIIGPFIACDTKANPSYTNVTSGFTPSGCGAATNGCILWGETSNPPQNLYNAGGCASGSTVNKVIEFVMTHDTTIKWTVDSVALTC